MNTRARNQSTRPATEWTHTHSFFSVGPVCRENAIGRRRRIDTGTDRWSLTRFSCLLSDLFSKCVGAIESFRRIDGQDKGGQHLHLTASSLHQENDKERERDNFFFRATKGESPLWPRLASSILPLSRLHLRTTIRHLQTLLRHPLHPNRSISSRRIHYTPPTTPPAVYT